MLNCFILLVFVCASLVRPDIQCTRWLDRCSCQTDHGVISLKSISSSNGTARFKDLRYNAEAGYFYSYDPCYPFTEDSCDNTVICITRKHKINGTMSNTTTSAGDGNKYPRQAYDGVHNTLTYAIGTSSGVQRDSAEVRLVCNRTYHKPVLKLVSTTFILIFTLTTRCACPNACPHAPVIMENMSTHSTPTLETTEVILNPERCETQIDSCSCLTKGGKTISLWPLQKTDGTPRFQDIMSKDGYTYSYNPCSPFTEGQCQNVSVCQLSNDSSSYSGVGNSTMAYWKWDSANNYIAYLTDTEEPMKRSYVTLICDPRADPATLEPTVSDSRQRAYYFLLRSKCACPNSCAGVEPTTIPPPITTEPIPVGKCSGRYGCSCKTERGEIIDLTTIGNKDRTARFYNIPGKDGFLYSYNPCYPFDQLDCRNSAVCRETESQDLSFSTGEYATATFEYDGVNNHLVYWAPGEHSVDRKTDVTLICDVEATTPALHVIGERQTQQYFLTLKTVCACPGKCVTEEGRFLTERLHSYQP